MAQVLDLYQAIDPPSEQTLDTFSSLSSLVNTTALDASGPDHGGVAIALTSSPRDEFPPNSFVYTVGGIVGSCLTVISILTVAMVIWAQGYKSTRIPALCKVSVYLMYLSGNIISYKPPTNPTNFIIKAGPRLYEYSDSPQGSDVLRRLCPVSFKPSTASANGALDAREIHDRPQP